MIGSTLDKYEVLQKVGEGGMATVYRGRHTTLGRDVAIKVLHPHLSSSTRNRKRFAREARAIEHLRHDNILEIFDYSGAEAEDCYIVTEFVGGRTLTDLMIEHGRLPGELTAIIGVALARALAYAHHSHVLHRDLKPDNVMLRFDGTIKLMDFGIARFLDESQVTMTGALVGSPAFMSPEQAREQNLDARSDLFSLGTLLFYLASGHLPFTGSNPSIILKNIIEGNRVELGEVRPSISASLIDVVERLLQVDREERFTTADEVEHLLRESLTEVQIDPDEAQWTLTAWLEDPEAYERRLDAHLREVLLIEGRRLLQAGEALEALRLLNRLLAIDEDNAEVLELVQGLHATPARRRPRTLYLVLGMGGLALAAFVVLGLIAGWNQPDPSPSDPAAERADRTEPLVAPDPAVVTATPIVDTSEPDAAPARAPKIELPADPEPSASPTTDRRTAIAAPAIRSSRQDRARAQLQLAEEPEPAVTEGCLEVRTRNTWAFIFLNGEGTGRKTNAPECIPVPAGTHTVLLQGSALVEDLEMAVTVAAGETKRVQVALPFKPIQVDFPETYDSACALRVGGRPRGTLEELGRRVVLDRRVGLEHELDLDCPDGTWSATISSEEPSLQVDFAARQPL